MTFSLHLVGMSGDGNRFDLETFDPVIAASINQAEVLAGALDVQKGGHEDIELLGRICFGSFVFVEVAVGRAVFTKSLQENLGAGRAIVIFGNPDMGDLTVNQGRAVISILGGTITRDVGDLRQLIVIPTPEEGARTTARMMLR